MGRRARQEKAITPMKNATAIPRASLTFGAALRPSVPAQAGHTVVLPDHNGVERRRYGFDGRVARCHPFRAVCRELLTIAGLGILLYSAAMLI